MKKKVVAVLFGGQSSEHEISKISAATVISNMSRDKYYIIPVYITKDGKWMIYDGPVENISGSRWEKYAAHAVLSPDSEHKGLLRIVGDKVKIIPVDIVFPVLHGKYGEDGTVQGLIELSGIPYVGCGVLASSLSMDKAYTKIICADIGIEQAKHIVVYSHELEEDINGITAKAENEIGYPCFVKPSRAGSSVGVSKASNKEELEKALIYAAENDSSIIIEKCIFGRELECAVLGNLSPKASTVGEIKAAADFYDFDAKYNNKESKTIVPAELEENIREEIREKAVKIFTALGCKGLSRVDFFLENETNKVIFNEINTMPGFTSISMYPMLWAEAGISLKELIDNLIELGFESFEEGSELQEE